MIRRLGLGCMLLLCTAVWPSIQLVAHPNAEPTMTKIKDFGPNPGNLTMHTYVPKGISKATEKVPLVIALHGCQQTPQSMASQSGWNELADAHGFIIVYPGQKRINNPSGCFNWFRPKDQTGAKGEVASIRNMIAYAQQHYPVDNEQIYIYGLSAGAAMTVNMLVAYPCLFEGGASLAGGAYGLARNALQGLAAMKSPPDRTPAAWGESIAQPPQELSCSWPRLVIVQGTKDKVVDPRNATELVDQWSWQHQIDPKTGQTDSAYAGNPLVARTHWQSPTGQEAIILYHIDETGHALPVDPGTGPRQGGKTGVFAVDRDFFSTWYIARDFGILREDK